MPGIDPCDPLAIGLDAPITRPQTPPFGPARRAPRAARGAGALAGGERALLRGVEAITGVAPFPSVTSYSNHASDHAAVWVDVEL
jgi:hypothetical protein